ncbi:putative short-chain dehydrogenase [Xylariaceae sp. FL1272]|nr:putative short-chain dehydrogenase [Xylariaceae sp. FL1272]
MSFICSQLFVKLPYPKDSCAGKTVIVTGSNTGLGKEAVRHYIRLGAALVIIAVRNLEKGAKARDDIIQTTKCSANRLQVWELDMASYASVKAFAERATNELDRIDIVNANAGLAAAAYTVSEGNETMITVNFISTYYLLALLMPKLRHVAAQYAIRPTFCITGSGAHAHTTFPQKSAPEGQLIARCNDKATFEAHATEQYPVSKLLPLLALRHLAVLHPADSKDFPVTVNNPSPGLCISELARDANSFLFWLFRMIFARSTEVGSRTVVHGGSAGKETHGLYLEDCKVGKPSAIVNGQSGADLAKRVWDELSAVLEGVEPGVMKNF